VNCKQVGCPLRPQSEHETSSSGKPVFLFSFVSPKQKSQYGDGDARGLSFLSPGCDLFIKPIPPEDNTDDEVEAVVFIIHLSSSK
jgi:hypothetical protein